MDELKDGTDELVNGATKLNNGANELKSGSSKINSGASDIAKYTSTLSDGTKELLGKVINDESLKKKVNVIVERKDVTYNLDVNNLQFA